jgi:hypothetical protein
MPSVSDSLPPPRDCAKPALPHPHTSCAPRHLAAPLATRHHRHTAATQ